MSYKTPKGESAWSYIPSWSKLRRIFRVNMSSLAPLNRHRAKPFDPDAADNRLSKTLLTCSSSMAPISTLVRRKIDSALEPVAATKADAGMMEDPPRSSDSESEEHHCRGSSRHRSKNCHSKREDHHVKSQSLSPRSPEGNYDLQAELESDNEVLSIYKRHNHHCRTRSCRQEVMIR